MYTYIYIYRSTNPKSRNPITHHFKSDITTTQRHNRQIHKSLNQEIQRPDDPEISNATAYFAAWL